MRMNRKVAFAAGACITIAAIAACSDSATSPTATPRLNQPSLDITVPAGGDAVAGSIKVCKVWDNDPQGTMTTIAVTSSVEVDAPVTETPLVITSPANLANGTCATVATSGDNGAADSAAVDETVPANSNLVSVTKITEQGAQSAYTPGTLLNVNQFHGWTVVFTNHFTPPPPPSSGCTFTWGYWKTHGLEAKGNNTNQWPAQTITLGSVNYSASEIQSIFDTAPKGNGLISLAHQLIAAKFNLLAGASDPDIGAVIDAADALIGSKVVPPVGDGFIDPAVSSALETALDNFNSGITGPGHCD
jgi:hypothetical protein